MGTLDGAGLFGCVFLLTAGLASAVAGLVIWLRSRGHSKRCTLVTQGTITALTNKPGPKFLKPKEKPAAQVVAANEAIAAKKKAYQERKRAEERAEREASIATWVPEVTYEVGGVTYVRDAVRGVDAKRHKVGQPVKVFYAPDDPSFAWFDIDGLATGVGMTLMACGAGLIAIGAACYFIFPMMEAIA